MTHRRMSLNISRRNFLAKTALAGAALSGFGRHAFAESRVLPTVEKPSELFLATLGPARSDPTFSRALEAFANTTGVSASLKHGGDTEFFRTVVSWFAAGEQMDAIFVRENFFAPFVESGLIQPITDMPGVRTYLDEANPHFSSSMERDNEIWGLPLFGEIMMMVYNEENFSKAGLTSPPETWEDFMAQAEQAQNAGFKHPVLWSAGQGDSHLPWQWFSLVWSNGDSLFEADGTPKLGQGSVARESLKWWRDTFLESEVSDPRSTELRYIPSMKAFMAGEHVFLAFTTNSWVKALNDPAQSPIAGKVKLMKTPGTGQTFGSARMLSLVGTSTDPEWSYEMMQYIAGKNGSGDYAGPKTWAEDIGSVPTYAPLFDDPELQQQWSESFDVDVFRDVIQSASHLSDVVPIAYEGWYNEWISAVNIEVQNCILGRTSADAACDALAEKATALKG